MKILISICCLFLFTTDVCCGQIINTIDSIGLYDIGNIVFDTWQKIWDLEDQNKLDRSYSYDYELYDERSNDPVNAQVGVHIGIK